LKTRIIRFSEGNNTGVAIAKGEYICILNPDTVVAEDTFQSTGFRRKAKDLGIVGVKLIDGAGGFLPESKRGVPTPLSHDRALQAISRVKVLGKYYAQQLAENETGKVDILVGAFMLVKGIYIKN
jgi:GT2 family glycosyltransferase